MSPIELPAGPGATGEAEGERGFSLIESLLATAASALLFSLFLGVFDQAQTTVTNLTRLMERDRNLILAPVLLGGWILGAGNREWNRAGDGILIQSGVLRIESDLDGKDGFPDGRVDGNFESLSLRCRTKHLQLKSGAGSFQSVLKQIRQWEIRMDGRSVNLRVTGAVSPNLLHWRSDGETTETIRYTLRNYRPNLFPPRNG
ncbi:MAG: hypothetical protein OXH11_03035 [Candidatus Aminicenantes bacterium]|nr:hypothetical protein [Candidatus Aminicenantes bacterium]